MLGGDNLKRAEIIGQLIDEKWKSKRSFAEEIGIPPTTLQSILQRGAGKASVDNIIKVCKGLGITVEQLEVMANGGNPNNLVELYMAKMNNKESQLVREEEHNYSHSKESQYTYYSTPVAAGLPSTIEGITENNAELIKLPDSIMGKYSGCDHIFVMRTNGDSMNKVFPSGSMIAVKQVELHELKDDDIVVFSDDHEYSVKRYFNDKINQRVIFSPDSTDRSFLDYSVPYEDAKTLKIHGKVVVYIVELD